ncbi:MAG: pyruvate oxidase [Legionella sp. 40-6]|mgnify:CR=1 FL=1|nr:MAG: pyruvate oxidase [Legionella sp. 40-6]
MANVAEVFVETLNAAGIKRIYGIVGDSLNGITNALQSYPDMQWIHVRHEEVGAFAAGAEAQLTGQLAVCAGSCGPGNLHLINGLYDCHRSGAPVLAIAAHIPSPEVGTDYFQETHPNILFKECSCFCEVVTSAEQIPRMLHIAMQTALAESGVAVLVLSGDIALEHAPHAANKNPLYGVSPEIIPPAPILNQLAQRLNESSKITLFCGIGAAHAQEEIIQLAQILQAPVVHTLRAKPYIEPNNPFDVGMTGLIGFSSGYHAMHDCDTLLLLGTSFPYRQFYPENTQIIQIDRCGARLGKRVALDMGIVGDIAGTLKALLPLLKYKDESAQLDKARTHYQKVRKKLDARAVPTADGQPLHPQYLAHCVSNIADEDTIFTCDVGTPTVWAARYLAMNGKRRLLGSFNHGSMANAMAQAIGVQAAFPKKQVVAFCGDGGFSMLMGDLLTLVQQQLPVKIIIFNNGALGFVEMEMHVAGMMDYGTDLKNPNFAALAEAVGIKGIRVDNASSLERDLYTAFAHEGPVVIDVPVHRDELILPPTLDMAQVKGFSLYMMKAILSGEGDAVVDLLKTNVWRD